jgi:hypothetical protein
MNFFSALALILLTLVGYASGSVLAARQRKAAPAVLDVVLVIILWAAALLTRPLLGKWLAIAAWLLAGLVLGFLITKPRTGRYAAEKAEPTPEAATGWRRIWNGWLRFSRRMGNYQSRLWLALFYFVLVLPFGFAMRLFDNPLRTRRRDPHTAWASKQIGEQDLENARSQF